MTFAVPQTVALAGRFELLRELGRGGAGVVYDAFDRVLRARVALKTVTSPSPESQVAFKREFRSVQGHHHPNVVRLGELFDDDGQLYFSMELVEGKRFTDYVRSRFLESSGGRSSLSGSAADGATATLTLHAPESSDTSDAPPKPAVKSWPAAKAVSVPPASVDPAEPRPAATHFDERRLRDALRGVASGLHALHRAGKVHRDIKPSNVLVTREGRVVILDLGLVTDLGQTPTHVVGTAHFMAPEQAAGQPAGPAADWYSVGVMLHFALTGRYPFDASAEAVVRVKQVQEGPTSLGEGLPPDLAELAMALLRRAPTDRPDAPTILHRLGLDPDEEANSLAAATFVGRRPELRQLHEALSHVSTARAALAVRIEGESGLGKSALLRQFVAEISGSTVIFAGRCYEHDRVPYKATDEVVDDLARHLARLPPEAVRALLPPDIGHLAKLFPSLRAVKAIGEAADIAAALDPQERRDRAFKALRELLHRIAATCCLVLSIDDFQWADAESLALLRTVFWTTPTPPLLLVLTVRIDSSSGGEAAAGAALLPPGSERVLSLQALSPDEANELAVELLRSVSVEGDEVDVAAVVDEARGHPLFVDTLVRYHAMAGVAPAQAGQPIRLDDALWARVLRLEGPARRLLEVSAVGDAPLSARILAHTTTSDPDEIERAIAVLKADQLVRTTAQGDETLVDPSHDRVRQTVRARLDAATAQAWHGRLALALEHVAPTELERLAFHWAEANFRERAATYEARAAEHAADTLAFDRAARLYEHALSLHTWPDRESFALRVRLGDTLGNAGRGKEAAQAYLSAIPLAPPDERLNTERKAAENLLRSGHFDEGAERMRLVLGNTGIASPVRISAVLTTLLLRRGHLRVRGLGFSPRAEADVPRALLQQADVCWSAGLGFGMADNLRGASFQTKGLLLALRTGEPYRIARAIGMEIAFVSTGGHGAKTRVEELYRVGKQLAEDTAHPHAIALVGSTYGAALFLRAEFRAALAQVDQGEHLLRTTCTGVPWELGSVRTFAAWSLWYLGEIGELGRRMPLYMRDAEQRGDRYFLTNLRGFVSNSMWLARGEDEVALRHANDALEGWSREGYHLQHFYDLVARAHIALYRGDAAAAHLELESRWKAFERSLSQRIELVRIVADFARGSVAVASVNGNGAANTLACAKRIVARLGRESAPWAGGLRQLLQGAIARRMGDDEGACGHYRSAATLLAQLGMRLYAEVANLRLGEVLGGDEGLTRVKTSTAWLSSQGVHDPMRYANMLSPAVRRR